MKKLLFILISMLMVCLSVVGCGNSSADNFIDPVEQTNEELKVYLPDISNSQLSNAVEDFKAYHPEIKLIVCNEEYYGVSKFEDMQKKVSAEIMSGSGPDIFCIDGSTFNDINKVIKSGVFFDLNQLIKNDSEFDRNDYLDVALKAGSYNGKQFIFPTGLATPVLLTSKTALDNTGFNLNKCSNSNKFFNEMNKYIESCKAEDNRFIIAPTIDCNNFLDLFKATDYKNMEVNIDNPHIKNLFKSIKLIQKFNMANKFEHSFDRLVERNYFKNDRILFYNYCWGYDVLDVAALINEYCEPILYPKYNIDGKIQSQVLSGIAINSQSPNKNNAYTFLKMGLDWQREPADKEERAKLNTNVNGVEDIPKEQYMYTRAVFLPVKKSRFEHDVSLIKKTYDKGVFYNERDEAIYKTNIKIKPLSQSFYNDFKKIYNNIEICTLQNTANRKAMELISPYLEDKKTLEECLKQAQSQLEIYISE